MRPVTRANDSGEPCGFGRWLYPFRRARLEEGSALVELAVTLPILALILVGTVDFARVFHTSIELINAARAGAQYGAFNVAQSGDVPGMVMKAVTIDPSFAATAARNCLCADDTGAFSGAVACTAPANSCVGGGHRVMTVTVTATKTFTTISGYVGILRAIPLTRVATLRVSE